MATALLQTQARFGITALEYARSNGLILENLTDDPLNWTHLPMPSLEEFWADLQDPDGAYSALAFEELQQLTGRRVQDRWNMTMPVVEFLASVAKLDRKVNFSDATQVFDIPVLRDLRLEVHILVTDFNLDLMALRHRNALVINLPKLKGRLAVDGDETQHHDLLSVQMVQAASRARSAAEARLSLHEKTASYLRDIAKPQVVDGVEALHEDLRRAKVRLSHSLDGLTLG